MSVKVNPALFQDNPDFGELFTGPDFSQCLAWDDRGIWCWDDNPFCWDDACIVLELIGGGPTEAMDRYEAWEEEKKKQFITLYLKVKGQEGHIYSHEYVERREKITTANVTIKDIEFVAENVLRPLLEIVVEK